MSDWFKKKILEFLIYNANAERTPKEWCELLGTRILDWDGWQYQNTDQPLGLAEFIHRYCQCTVER
jgi:hypothetical protein